MPYPGEILAGLYQIEREIGKGGAGIIYLAWHLNLKKHVVVKKIKENFVGILEARGEVDILKSLHHTCLPQVYDFLQIGNEIYTVMEYIEGYDLKYYIDQGYQFEESMLMKWLVQLLEVLGYLHEHGILHMDIKPANIMVTEEWNVCLIDFNISFAGEGDVLTGISEVYASPEQYRKWQSVLYSMPDKEGPLDAGTDIYSLGASFYHVMTGYMPVPVPEKLVPITDFALPYSEELIQVIRRMMHPDRRKRYQSAERVLHALGKLRRTKEEKRTLRIVFWGMLAGILTISLIFGIILYRNSQYVSRETREMIQAEELRLTQLCQKGEYGLACQEGTGFLNTESRELDKLEGSRQSLLEKIVEACIGMEDYAAASQYLQELMEMEQRAEYYLDAAVIAAYSGDYETAEEALGNAEALGGDAKEIQRSRAELKAAQGQYAEAFEAYRAMEDGQEETAVLRRMAALALYASGDRPEYAEVSAAYYERLAASRMASYEDQMNLVTAYGLCGMDEKAMSRLQSMRAEYPDRYQVYLKLGILKYNAELKKPLASRDYTETRKYVQEALRLYDNENTGQRDEQLEELNSLLLQVP